MTADRHQHQVWVWGGGQLGRSEPPWPPAAKRRAGGQTLSRVSLVISCPSARPPQINQQLGLTVGHNLEESGESGGFQT